MGLTVAIIGKSGSGKTTITKMLADYYNVIFSYTDREPREEGEWGHTFYSIGTDTMEKWWDKPKKLPDEVVAHQKLYNGNHYWACKQQFDFDDVNLYIIDPAGAEQLKERLDMKIITVYFKCLEKVRFNRMKVNRTEEKAIQRIKQEDKFFNFKDFEYDYILNTTQNKLIIFKMLLDIIEMEFKKK